MQTEKRDFEPQPVIGKLEFGNKGLHVTQADVCDKSMFIAKMDEDSYYYKPVVDGIKARNTYGGYKEQQVQRFLLQYIKPHHTFIDIGAYCGFYTVITQSVCQYVYAFEPNPLAFWILYKNTINSDNVTSYPIALSNSDDWLYFSRFTHLTDKPILNTLRVNTKRLDSFNISAHIIKIDVEGMADKVIEGGIKTFGNADVILIELHKGEAPHHLINRLGFRIKYISHNHIIAYKPNLPIPDTSGIDLTRQT